MAAAAAAQPDVVEEFLNGLIGEGFSDEAAVAAYRAFTSFLLGHLLLEVAVLGADVGPLDVLDDGEPRNERPLDHPTSHASATRSPRTTRHRSSRRRSTESLLDRLALLQSESSSGGAAVPDPA